MYKKVKDSQHYLDRLKENINRLGNEQIEMERQPDI